ncbi:hypothetical protein K2173_021188 [Erythroxylum novogranatense]|uniref:CUE domain-containing protein n=1 Tax=Erythroxylum novogranatense TaxID=1862640 RepID=A0AAV8TPW3_9ROSI|nr:hypothetical protein K2173_021188 [Erythroxylum novogranatense]
MSAIVCGKRSFFEELNVTTPPKRIRCSSSSPVRFSPPRPQAISSSNTLQRLVALFPDMDKQVLERALEECGDDLDSAIRSLNDLRLGSAEKNFSPTPVKSYVLKEDNATVEGTSTTNDELPPIENSSAPTNLPMDGPEWVELFVREMMCASNIDDARSRASKALEALEKSICARAGTEAAKNFHQVLVTAVLSIFPTLVLFSFPISFFNFNFGLLVRKRGLQRDIQGLLVLNCCCVSRSMLLQENVMLKEQVQALIQENTILKRAVAVQHERQKEYENKSQELQHMKQLVSQYQEQMRTLEVNNYALTVHLKQAQQSNSIPGRFHPDVF